jgi:Cys-rich four helix bundle protein (predicted Tat secretion target)
MKDGQACLDHCFTLLEDGDKEMARCAESVTEMRVMCDSLAKMACYRSPHLKDFAKVCAAVCKDCEDECKACADSCGDCIDACEKIV